MSARFNARFKLNNIHLKIHIFINYYTKKKKKNQDIFFFFSLTALFLSNRDFAAYYDLMGVDTTECRFLRLRNLLHQMRLKV